MHAVPVSPTKLTVKSPFRFLHAPVELNTISQQLHVAHVGGGGGGGGAGGGGAGGGGAGGGGGGGGAEQVDCVKNIDEGHVPTAGVPLRDIDIEEQVLLLAVYVAVAVTCPLSHWIVAEHVSVHASAALARTNCGGTAAACGQLDNATGNVNGNRPPRYLAVIGHSIQSKSRAALSTDTLVAIKLLEQSGDVFSV